MALQASTGNRWAGPAVLRTGAIVMAGLMALAGCGTETDQGASSPSAPTPSTSGTPSPSPSGSPCATPTEAAGIYYVADVPDVGPRLYREFHRVGTCADAVTEALDHMFATPAVDPDYSSLWPTGTRVLDVSISGTTATVDVSQFPSLGSSFEGAAVQQLVWTATAADPGVTAVLLRVDGQEPPSGHVDLAGPVARGNALDTRANVWILAPEQGAAVGSPVQVEVSGTGWEGNVPLVVYQGDTEVASDQVTTEMGGFAEAGTTFDLPAGDYTLKAYNDNGRDSSLQLWDTKDFTVTG